jgi:stearoyl-CoA desaturase (delta-9 desaturase)
MFENKNPQVIKFYITVVCAFLGLFLYVQNEGTLFKAVLIYLGFTIVSKIANVGYHRWLAHNLLEPGIVWRKIFLWSMVSSALVKPLPYVVGHRAHHKYSDTELDPHHTGLGLWNCIIGNFNSSTYRGIPIKDLLRKKDVMFVNQHYWKLYFANLAIFFLIDIDIFLLSFLLLNLRMWLNIAVFNYVAHGGGTPRNLPAWTAYILGYSGEQLHKNHHDNPSSSNFGTVSTFNFDVLYHIYKRVVKVKN